MVSCEQRPDGWVKIDLSEFRDLVGCQVFYSLNQKQWQPAALCKSLSTQHMASESWYAWNDATTKGLVGFQTDDEACVFWHPYLDARQHDAVHMQIHIATVHGVDQCVVEVALGDHKAIYLDDWQAYIADGTTTDPQAKGKWLLSADERGRVTISCPDKELPPEIVIVPGITGLYDLYVGLERGTTNLQVRVDQPHYATARWTFGESGTLFAGNLHDKRHKEVWLATISLNSVSHVTIAPITTRLTDGSALVRPLGSISYFKLVPATARRQVDLGMPLVLCFEPGTWNYYDLMDGPDEVRDAIAALARWSPTEITCQVARVGMRTLHHSRFIETQDGAHVADEGRAWDGAARMVQRMDVLRVAAEASQDLGIPFSVNLAVNRPYVGNTNLTDRFVRENPQLIKGGLLDYERPGVMDYALRIIEESVREYPVTGLFLDFMRTEDNQTERTLIEFVARTRALLDAQRDRGRLRLSLRIPWAHPVYYAAAAEWVRQGQVDAIVPSNPAGTEPLPRIEHYVALCRNSATQVLGCVDGWKGNLLMTKQPGFTYLSTQLTPDDVQQLLKYYRQAGAQGAFFYQAENYVLNPLQGAKL